MFQPPGLMIFILFHEGGRERVGTFNWTFIRRRERVRLSGMFEMKIDLFATTKKQFNETILSV